MSAMRPFGKTIPLDEARALIEARCRPITRTEIVPLHEANGRVLAGDVTASIDVPPFDRAAMDGYAVRAADTTGASRNEPRVLRCIDRVFTGQMPGRAVAAGQCIEVATGAPMPDGADAVVMVEESERDGSDEIRILSPVGAGQHVGRRGSDVTVGQAMLRDGEWLNPSRIGALAALGRADASVYSKPRVAILSTGNEITDPGRPLEPGHIYDINRFTLMATVTEHGGFADPHRTAADSIEDLSDAFEECLDADIVVFSGGSSVGERDLLIDVLAEKGHVLFHGISVKPGKPTAFGVVGDTLVFGMPGYPTSCLSNAYILLVPALRRVARLPPHRLRTIVAPLGRRVVSAPGRHQFYTVRIVDGVAMPAFKASGDITSMSQADGYIEIPADVDAVAEGEMVDVTLF